MRLHSFSSMRFKALFERARDVLLASFNLPGNKAMSHRIVIVGGGAGGLELATRLGKRLGLPGRAHIVLVDCNLTHVWKPLLHEVASGSLDFSENDVNYLAQARWNHFEFQPGILCGLDRGQRQIQLDEALDDGGGVIAPARRIAYDTLVLAIGSRSADFGVPGVREHCSFLDTTEEALRFHRRLLGRYLQAHARSPEGEGMDGHDALDVVIVGGGATGVELAAELRYASRLLPAYGLASIAPQRVRITVLDRAPRLLAALPERVGRDAAATLAGLDVRVSCNVAVSEVTGSAVFTADGERIPAHFVVWAAGIEAPPLLGRLDGLETNPRNQLRVRRSLQTTRDDDVFAMGDCAACPLDDEGRRVVPPLAQAAQQQARFLAGNLARKLEGRPLADFVFRNHGSLVPLADYSAVGNLMGNLLRDVTLEGRLARFFYGMLYRRHQAAVHGVARTALAILMARIRRRTEPRLKLH